MSRFVRQAVCLILAGCLLADPSTAAIRSAPDPLRDMCPIFSEQTIVPHLVVSQHEPRNPLEVNAAKSVAQLRGHITLADLEKSQNSDMKNMLKNHVREMQREIYGTLAKAHRHREAAARKERGQSLIEHMARGAGPAEATEGWLEHLHYYARNQPAFDAGLLIQPHLGLIFAEATGVTEEFILIGQKTKTHTWLFPEVIEAVKRYRLTRNWLEGRFKGPEPIYVLGRGITPGAEPLFFLHPADTWNEEGLWTDDTYGVTYRRIDLSPAWHMRQAPTLPRSEASSILDTWSSMSQLGGHQILVGPEAWHRFKVIGSLLEFIPEVLASRFIVLKNMSLRGQRRPFGRRAIFYGTQAEFQIVKRWFPNTELMPMDHFIQENFHKLLQILWKSMPSTTEIDASWLGEQPFQEYLAGLLIRSGLWDASEKPLQLRASRNAA